MTAPGNDTAYDSEEDETISSPTVQVTAPGNGSVSDPAEDTSFPAGDTLISAKDTSFPTGDTLISAGDATIPEDVVGRSDMHAHGKGLVKPYVVVVPQSSDDITYVDPAEEPLVGSDEVPLAHSLDEFARIHSLTTEIRQKAITQGGLMREPDIRIQGIRRPTHALFHLTLLSSITQQKPRKPRLRQSSIRSWNRSTLTQRPNMKK